MDVTALCTRLLIRVVMVLVVQGQNTCAHKDGAAFLRISPKRLQFFEYEVISFNCMFDGSADWRLMRTLQQNLTNSSLTWLTSAGSKVITAAFSPDSGEYWCEDGDGLRTNSINITVTTGSVILESPALPVKEGDNVTLQCKKKKSAAGFAADFYKDGLLLKTGYNANRTIHNVSTSDEGLYKCFIPGAGESPESRLVVEGSKHQKVSGPSSDITTSGCHINTSHEETHPAQSPASGFLNPLRIAVTVVLLVVLLVIGVMHFRKHKSTEDKTKRINYRVSGGESLDDSHHVTVAVVQKKPRERGH